MFATDLLKQIRARGCSIFMVTARSKSSMQETIHELKDVGITPDLYQDILFGDVMVPHKTSKLAHCNKIREAHALNLAVGDRTIDLIDLDEDITCD